MYKPWLRALCLASWYLAIRADWIVTVCRLYSLAKMLFRKRYKHLETLRMPYCRRCPMFNDGLQTCGYPGEMYWNSAAHRVEPEGCWCFMPVATQIQSKDCWLRENGSDQGWPDAVRFKGL